MITRISKIQKSSKVGSAMSIIGMTIWKTFSPYLYTILLPGRAIERVCTGADGAGMVSAARALLAAVTRVLLLADMVVVRQLLLAKDKVISYLIINLTFFIFLCDLYCPSAGQRSQPYPSILLSVLSILSCQLFLGLPRWQCLLL